MQKDKISVFYLVTAILFWLITAMWMVLIFYLSAETASDSSERSSWVLEWIVRNFGTQNISELMVRKGFHVIEYAVLALTSFMSVRSTNLISEKGSYAESRVKFIKSDNEMYILISLWISMLFAIFDEYHQLFVEGRSGSIMDVGIDLIGVVFTLLVIRVIFTLYLRKLGRSEIRYD